MIDETIDHLYGTLAQRQDRGSHVRFAVLSPPLHLALRIADEYDEAHHACGESRRELLYLYQVLVLNHMASVDTRAV